MEVLDVESLSCIIYRPEEAAAVGLIDISISVPNIIEESIFTFASNGASMGKVISWDITGLEDDASQLNTAYFELPAMYRGSPVIGVRRSAFHQNTLISGALIIPGTIQEIEASAFDGCTGLTALKLSEGIQKIDGNAFNSNTGMKGDLIIPDSVTEIGVSAFSDCGFNGFLSLGDGLNRIESYAFRNCIFPENLVIPPSVTTVEHNVFEGSLFPSIEVPWKEGEKPSGWSDDWARGFSGEIIYAE